MRLVSASDASQLVLDPLDVLIKLQELFLDELRLARRQDIVVAHLLELLTERMLHLKEVFLVSFLCVLGDLVGFGNHPVIDDDHWHPFERAFFVRLGLNVCDEIIAHGVSL